MRRTLAAVSLAGLAVLAACGGNSSTPRADPTATESVPLASPSDTVPAGVDVTDLEDGAVGLAAVGTAVWAALPEPGQVLATHGQRIDVGSLPLRLVETPQGVWVSVIGDGTLVRIDPGTGEVDLRTTVRPHGSEPEGLAYDGSTVWVVDQAGNRVLPLDPASGRLGTAIPVGGEPRLVTVGRSGVYVTNYTEGSVTRVVDGTGTTRNAGSCLTPQGLAEAAGVLWVACTVDDQVVGLDAVTLKPVTRLPDLPAADAVVADGDTVYVVGQEGPTVWTIDARTRKVTGTLVLDSADRTTENVAAALVGRRLAVSHPDARRLYDVPLRLLAG